MTYNRTILTYKEGLGRAGDYYRAALRDDPCQRSQGDNYMTHRSDKNKMAALLKRTLRTNTSTSLVIHHLKRLSPCEKLCLPDCSFYTTESAASRSEEFSLRYLEGKHEGISLNFTNFFFFIDRWEEV